MDHICYTSDTSKLFMWLVLRASTVFFLFVFYEFIYLLTYFWLCWVFVAACGLSLVVASGGYSSLRCVGSSLRWLLLLRSTGSRRAGVSSCGTWENLYCL